MERKSEKGGVKKDQEKGSDKRRVRGQGRRKRERELEESFKLPGVHSLFPDLLRSLLAHELLDGRLHTRSLRQLSIIVPH